MRKFLFFLIFAFFALYIFPIQAQAAFSQAVTPSNPSYTGTVTVTYKDYYTCPDSICPNGSFTKLEVKSDSSGAGTAVAEIDTTKAALTGNCLNSSSGWTTVSCSNASLTGTIRVNSLLSSAPTRDVVFVLYNTAYFWNGSRMAPGQTFSGPSFTVKGSGSQSSFTFNSISPNPATFSESAKKVTLNLTNTNSGVYKYGLLGSLNNQITCPNGTCSPTFEISSNNINPFLTEVTLQVREESTGATRQQILNLEFVSENPIVQINKFPNPLLGTACPRGSYTNKEGCGVINTAIGNISTSPKEFVRKILGIVLGISGGILILLLMINGYKLMVSQGDPEKTREGRDGIIAAIAGILLIIFSFVLLQLITVNILGLPGFGP